MRDSLKQEVALIAQGTAREIFTHTGLMIEVSREVHARLPETIRQHADVLLPYLAQAAVTAVTPDPAETHARLLEGLRQAFDSDARDLVTRAAEGLLPELTAAAVRNAAPDPAKVRAELVEAATLELADQIRGETADALASVVAQSTERVSGAVTESVERESRLLIPELVRAAVAAATPDTDEIRADLISGASGTVLEAVRVAVKEAAPRAVAAEIEASRCSLTDAVTATAQDVLPNLARHAVEQLTPDLAKLRAQVTDHAQISAAEAVEQETGKAIPAVVEAAVTQVREMIGKSVDEAVDKKLAEFTPNVVMVTLPAGKQIKLGSDAHAVLPELLVALHARCHVLLVGPAGTGKSMLAKHAALALDIPFQALSLGPTTPMSKVFGYYDANGHYHDTPFRRAFEHGGVMLLDELDNGHPGLLAELNQALALSTCAFADRMVDAHPDFRLVATGNTYGAGGDRQYAGRQTLDSATLDRFVVIDVPIDEGLEERIALRHAPSHQDAARDLLTKIRELRAAAADKNLPVLFSPRASIDGAKLLEAGATVDQVMRWRVVRGLSPAHSKTLGLS
ncbi:AAA family ATPase [Amycolatopsis sp. H20-H5]|uniref:AAA family ATPase n=1 Tax=Amycolatopsis sp. H20-H5 TaxID=3046309 RepID=UPI002DBEE4BE|nr:AAA family ATPase [Amycolatopsis sp. H20-H5]MEC3975928.1 AAA family ATPase [Amycolatopsis sp. H20-H5]